MVYRESFEQGRQRLEQAEIEEAALDARLLLEYVCHTDRNTLLVHGDRMLTEEEQSRFDELIRSRATRVPLQHLTGTQEFMGLEFQVNEHVLIPRQDTELLVEEVLRGLHDGMRVLDLCTGSGCILISILKYSNYCTGVGVDISEEALSVARRNAECLLCPGAVGELEKMFLAQTEKTSGSTCTFLRSDLFEKVEGKYEVIVSNPPYIARNVIGTLMPEVRDHEPLQALDGGEDGLYFYREIIRQSPKFLIGGGSLYFEIGYDQGQAVSRLMEEAGFREVQVMQDYAGMDRIVSGVWTEE